VHVHPPVIAKPTDFDCTHPFDCIHRLGSLLSRILFKPFRPESVYQIPQLSFLA
jgi:hypothetical protein